MENAIISHVHEGFFPYFFSRVFREHCHITLRGSSTGPALSVLPDDLFSQCTDTQSSKRPSMKDVKILLKCNQGLVYGEENATRDLLKCNKFV